VQLRLSGIIVVVILGVHDLILTAGDPAPGVAHDGVRTPGLGEDFHHRLLRGDQDSLATFVFDVTAFAISNGRDATNHHKSVLASGAVHVVERPQAQSHQVAKGDDGLFGGRADAGALGGACQPVGQRFGGPVSDGVLHHFRLTGDLPDLIEPADEPSREAVAVDVQNGLLPAVDLAPRQVRAHVADGLLGCHHVLVRCPRWQGIVDGLCAGFAHRSTL